jgi:hypothetical protein
MYAFAAVKADGSITAWGSPRLMHEFQFEYFRGFVTFVLPQLSMGVANKRLIFVVFACQF